jgi:hypothetical protein
MGCGASVTVKNESPALEARVSLPEFKQWYLKLLVKDASKAAKVRVRPPARARVCKALVPRAEQAMGSLRPRSRRAVAPCAPPPNPLQ